MAAHLEKAAIPVIIDRAREIGADPVQVLAHPVDIGMRWIKPQQVPLAHILKALRFAEPRRVHVAVIEIVHLFFGAKEQFGMLVQHGIEPRCTGLHRADPKKESAQKLALGHAFPPPLTGANLNKRC